MEFLDGAKWESIQGSILENYWLTSKIWPRVLISSTIFSIQMNLPSKQFRWLRKGVLQLWLYWPCILIQVQFEPFMLGIRSMEFLEEMDQQWSQMNNRESLICHFKSLEVSQTLLIHILKITSDLLISLRGNTINLVYSKFKTALL